MPLRPPGLGPGSDNSSFVSTCEDNDHAPNTLTVGQASVQASRRTKLRFVRATALSDPSLQTPPGETDELSRPHASTPLSSRQSDQSQQSLSDEMANNRQHRSMAELYAALTRDMAHDTTAAPPTSCVAPSKQPNFPHATDASRSTGRFVARSAAHRNVSGTAPFRQAPDWFVSRALAKLRDQQQQQQQQQHRQAPAETTERADSCDTESPGNEQVARGSGLEDRRQCPDCGESIACDASPTVMALHRQSITHRISLNSAFAQTRSGSSDNKLPEQPGSRQRDKVTAERCDRKRSVTSSKWKRLRSDNVGYGLLARMGWREGMGLGINEWQWQQFAMTKRRGGSAVQTASPKASDAAHQPAHLASSHAGADQSVGQAIVLSSDEEDISIEATSPASRDGDGAPMDNLGPIDWMRNLPRVSATAEDGYEFGDDVDPFAPADAASGPVDPNQPGFEDRAALIELPRPSVMMAPIDVDLKTDRLGLGMRPKGARRPRDRDDASEDLRKRKVGSSDGDESAHREATASDLSKHGSGTKRMTKAARKRAEEKNQADWLAIRVSLF
ncbi:hypothetical protein ACQY0O_004480 [Thecaphora frezii]